MNTSAATQSNQRFQQAVALHQRGMLGEAQAIYEEILRLQPEHFGALHLSGVIAAQTGRFEMAADLIGRALEVNPNDAAAHSNRGGALKELKQLEAALASYDRAIAIRGDYAEAYANRGVVLSELERFDAALASYDRAIAIKPAYAEAHYNRGNTLMSAGRLSDALASYDRAISQNPHHAEAHYNRGNALKELKRPDAALAGYDRAIACRSGFAEAHCNRGVVLNELGQFDSALASYEAAILLKPDYAEAHCNRATVLIELNRLEPALASCDRAIALDSAYAEAHSNRGVVLKELGQWDAALACHDRAIMLKPGYAGAHSNRALLFHEMNQLDAALASYDKAIAVNSDFAEARLNRAMALLLAGDYENGWAEYEWRWRGQDSAHCAERRAFAKPLWLGKEAIAGKSLLLHAEQGLGDTLQFCRYARLAAEAGSQVILEVPKPLEETLAGLGGVAQLVAYGQELPAFDYHCPLMSLPLAFKTTLSTIPANIPYLRSNPQKMLYWKEKLRGRAKLRVGLVWSGGFRADQPELWSVNKRRNIPLAKLAPLKHPGIEFYSLQKGQPAESELSELLANHWDGPPLIDYTGLLDDFSDTAALIENLDLVISVDTSTAHLAGALGKPVWLLNRYDSCWRWLLNRSDSPWYPSMRIYRQARALEWNAVIDRVRQDLLQLAA